MNFILRLSSALLVILMTVWVVDAQTPTGSVSGNVADSTGAQVAGATVRIINTKTHETHSTDNQRLRRVHLSHRPPGRVRP